LEVNDNENGFWQRRAVTRRAFSFPFQDLPKARAKVDHAPLRPCPTHADPVSNTLDSLPLDPLCPRPHMIPPFGIPVTLRIAGLWFQVIFGIPCLGNLRCPPRQPHPARSGRPGRSSTISYSYHPYHPYRLCIIGGFRDKIASPCVLDIARSYSSQLRCQIHPGPPYSMWTSHDSLC